MSYDVDEIKRIADCRDIARHLGLEVNKYYCTCPSGTHSETKINHCSIHKDFFTCFSCGCKGDVFKLVEEACRCDFKEALEIVADYYGIAESVEFKSNHADAPPFSNDDLKLIGLPKEDAKFSGGVARITMANIWYENEELYYDLVEQQALIELKRIKYIEPYLKGTELEDELASRYKIVEKLYNQSKK